MTTPTRSVPLFSHRLIVGAVLFAGFVFSVLLYREGRNAERERAEAAFVHRATLRHALTREILGHFEDALFGLSALFMFDANVTPAEFARATDRLHGRISGVQAFEWVPLVADAHRSGFERRLQAAYAPVRFAFTERDAAGRLQPAKTRPVYYPIVYVEPLTGNEAALGYDLRMGPSIDSLERARASGQMVVTPPLRLVQESGAQQGIVMVLPVYTANPSRQGGEAGDPPDGFMGFLQGVFRVHDLLETAHASQPDTMLDMLFVDASEQNPDRRTLYHRPADDRAPRTSVSDTEFRRGLHREFRLPFGQRDWRVLFRPQAGWLESQLTLTPLARSLTFMLLSGLVAGIVHILGRRADTVRQLVDKRTAELAESRRQFAGMVHALPGMAYRCRYDDELTVQFVSEGAKVLTGWSAGELMAGTPHYRDCIHPDDLARVREVTRAALQAHEDVEVEYRLRTREGEEKWVLSRGRGSYGPEGKLDVFEGLAIDITAQKNAESSRLALERRLLEGQKLESLGLLAGGIAHDFNNLLSSIVGNVGLARISLGGSTAADSHLRAIEVASLRAADLCHQMLAYAGKGRFFTEAVDVSALTEDLLSLLKVSTGHQATLELKLERDVPAVLADATQLRQIIMNLVLNAADAIGAAARADGAITLTSGVMRANAELLAACVAGAGLPAGDYVFVEVRDNGTGMTPDVMAKIFDPFFTTKFAGRGLGLAAVLGIVRGHHGALHVESKPGVGSCFRLLLPPAPPSRTANPLGAVGAAESSPWRHRGTALVIEDEEPVRVVTMEILKTYGFTVLGAADGSAGVEQFRKQPESIDLVMLDVLMPGMNGEQTLLELRALRPDVCVLLMSGYNEGDLVARLGGGPRLAFLAKPFTRATLERRLRELLG